MQSNAGAIAERALRRFINFGIYIQVNHPVALNEQRADIQTFQVLKTWKV
jgi:hypothetical protein